MPTVRDGFWPWRSLHFGLADGTGRMLDAWSLSVRCPEKRRLVLVEWSR